MFIGNKFDSVIHRQKYYMSWGSVTTCITHAEKEIEYQIKRGWGIGWRMITNHYADFQGKFGYRGGPITPSPRRCAAPNHNRDAQDANDGVQCGAK